MRWSEGNDFAVDKGPSARATERLKGDGASNSKPYPLVNYTCPSTGTSTAAP
jgi:hypothetical protein